MEGWVLSIKYLRTEGHPFGPQPPGAPAETPRRVIAYLGATKWNAGQSTSSTEISLQIHTQIHQHCMGFHENSEIFGPYRLTPDSTTQSPRVLKLDFTEIGPSGRSTCHQ